MKTSEFTSKYYRDRRNTDCVKWDSNIKGTLPMFIADMDFALPDKAIESIINRTKHGIFGYTTLPKDYYETFISWHKKRNNIVYKKEWIRFSKGAVDGLFQIIYSLTKKGDKVMVLMPSYPPFLKTLELTNRKAIKVSLTYKDNYYSMDLKKIEASIIKNKCKAFILCSPHNPVGRVWKQKEMNELLRICNKHKVLVIADEVHSDLILKGNKFIPALQNKKFQNNVVSIIAASKTFNLAAFSHCHLVIANKKLRDKLDEYQLKNHLNNPIAINAFFTYYCYKCGTEWVDSVLDVVKENYEYLKEHLSKYCIVPKLEGTYLVLLKFINLPKGKTAYDFLIKDIHVQPNAGETFDSKMTSYARINLATSLDNVKTLCNRIEEYYLKH